MPRFRQDKMRKQYMVNLAKAINSINANELNWSLGKFKNCLKKQLKTEINGTFNCFNDGCAECR